MSDENSQGQAAHDTLIVRPQMHHNDFAMRGHATEPATLRKIRKGLLTLHTLELMAKTIYRFQITSQKNELNQQLIAAMCNEMTHYQDFQVKLYEYGFKPNPLRWAFWVVGMVFGLGSRLLGVKAILKTGIWVETKAVHHYAELLDTIEWDQETRRIIEKDQADEDSHIRRWRKMLESVGK